MSRYLKNKTKEAIKAYDTIKNTLHKDLFLSLVLTSDPFFFYSFTVFVCSNKSNRSKKIDAVFCHLKYHKKVSKPGKPIPNWQCSAHVALT